jgi:hypothetical protein
MIRFLDCNICGYDTPHEEIPVNDLESATVWRCVFCGNKRRPGEHGGNDKPVLPTSPSPSDKSGVDLPKVEEKPKPITNKELMGTSV